MKVRYTFAACAVGLLFAAPAAASVISASSQTARSRPADRVDYLSVTAIQNELNVSLRDAADVTPRATLDSRSAPSTASGGFLVGSDTPGAADFKGGGGSVPGDYRGGGGGTGDVDAISRDSGGAGSGGWVLGIGSGHKVGGKGGHRGGGARDRGGVHPTPEPSTWLLLGVGLLTLGTYGALRRRGQATTR